MSDKTTVRLGAFLARIEARAREAYEAGAARLAPAWGLLLPPWDHLPDGERALYRLRAWDAVHGR